MKKKDNLQHIAIINLGWKYLERIIAQGIQLVVTLVLARILMPEDYGIIAIITIFTNILEVFIDSGLGNALIQKKDASKVDFSSVFIFNLFICVLLYSFMFISAPWIAEFYNNKQLTDIIRVLCLTLIISGFKNVQQAYVAKNMLFKKFFYATFIGRLISGSVGIIMAYQGMGVWALVAQQLLSNLMDTLILWLIVDWKPKFEFSNTHIKGLLNYGVKLLLSNLIDKIYWNSRSLIIGKLYTPSDLAFFDRGAQFPNLIVNNINASIDSVMFPVMSKCQDDRIKMRLIIRRAIVISTFAMMPLMACLAGVGETLIPLLLTDKWLPCLPFLYIFCTTCGFESLTTTNVNAIKALGRSDIMLGLELRKKAIGFVILLCAAPFGIMVIGYSCLLYSLVGMIINTRPIRNLLGYGLMDMLKDIKANIFMSIVVFISVYNLNGLEIDVFPRLTVQLFAGMSLYLFFACVFRTNAYLYVKNYINRI